MKTTNLIRIAVLSFLVALAIPACAQTFHGALDGRGVTNTGPYWQSNKLGWMFVGTNGLTISSNVNGECLIITTNRGFILKSNNVIISSNNPATGDLYIAGTIRAGGGTFPGDASLSANFPTFNQDSGSGLFTWSSTFPTVQSETASFGVGELNFSGGMNMVFDREVDANAFAGDGGALTGLNGANISSGTVAPARLGSGSSITTKFLRGDGTWQPAGAGSQTPWAQAIDAAHFPLTSVPYIGMETNLGTGQDFIMGIRADFDAQRGPVLKTYTGGDILEPLALFVAHSFIANGRLGLVVVTNAGVSTRIDSNSISTETINATSINASGTNTLDTLEIGSATGYGGGLTNLSDMGNGTNSFASKKEAALIAAAAVAAGGGGGGGGNHLVMWSSGGGVNASDTRFYYPGNSGGNPGGMALFPGFSTAKTVTNIVISYSNSNGDPIGAGTNAVMRWTTNGGIYGGTIVTMQGGGATLTNSGSGSFTMPAMGNWMIQVSNTSTTGAIPSGFFLNVTMELQ